MKFWKQMDGVKGFARDLFRKTFDEIHLIHSNDTQSPFYHLSFIPSTASASQAPMERVKSVLHHEQARAQFGFGFTELINLPYPVFEIVEQWVIDEVKADLKDKDKLNDLIKTLKQQDTPTK